MTILREIWTNKEYYNKHIFEDIGRCWCPLFIKQPLNTDH